jgi:hypothetical protein
MAGKMRSPNYPALSLTRALDAADKLWKAEKRTPVSNEAAAAGLGFKSLSGPARVTIGALRQFGLVDKTDKGHIRLSDLAVKVLHGSPDDKQAALRQAATTPKLFKELSQLHADGSEAAIQSYLITKKDFAEDGARKAAKAFRDTLRLAKQDASGYTRDDEQETPEDMPDIDTGQKDAAGGSDGKGGSGVLSLTVPYGSQGSQLTVQVRVTGERLNRSHIAKVRRYLEIAEEDLENGDV